jgi:hypothetical protein
VLHKFRLNFCCVHPLGFIRRLDNLILNIGVKQVAYTSVFGRPVFNLALKSSLAVQMDQQRRFCSYTGHIKTEENQLPKRRGYNKNS